MCANDGMSVCVGEIRRESEWLSLSPVSVSRWVVGGQGRNCVSRGARRRQERKATPHAFRAARDATFRVADRGCNSLVANHTRPPVERQLMTARRARAPCTGAAIVIRSLGME